MDVKKADGEDNWDLVIQPHTSWFDLNLADLWRYRDLLMLFVRRDFVAVYKQTILGPLWFFVQPILTTITFVIIFGRVAQISTDGIPPVLFYMTGIVAWNYFAECLTMTSNTFVENAGVFGKVYFPRLISPLSIVVSSLIKFGVQFALFLSVWVYYMFSGAAIAPTTVLLFFPVLVIIMAGLGLGLGIIISSLTTKYRDLRFLVTFGVQLLMYATPIVYPLSIISEGKYKMLILANPMTGIVETFRYAFLGTGSFELSYLLYSGIFMLCSLFIGVLIFNKVEKGFMDTV